MFKCCCGMPRPQHRRSARPPHRRWRRQFGRSTWQRVPLRAAERTATRCPLHRRVARPSHIRQRRQSIRSRLPLPLGWCCVVRAVFSTHTGTDTFGVNYAADCVRGVATKTVARAAHCIDTRERVCPSMCGKLDLALPVRCAFDPVGSLAGRVTRTSCSCPTTQRPGSMPKRRYR